MKQRKNNPIKIEIVPKADDSNFYGYGMPFLVADNFISRHVPKYNQNRIAKHQKESFKSFI